MSFTAVVTRGYQSSSDLITDVETITADGQISGYSGVIPASSTNLEIDVTIPDFNAIKALMMKAAGDMTIKTNSTSVPDDTIALVATKALIWTPGCGLDNPFSADVTKIYVTSTAGGQLDIRGLQDLTP